MIFGALSGLAGLVAVLGWFVAAVHAFLLLGHVAPPNTKAGLLFQGYKFFLSGTFLPSGHPLFEQFSFLSADELPEYEAILARRTATEASAARHGGGTLDRVRRRWIGLGRYGSADATRKLPSVHPPAAREDETPPGGSADATRKLPSVRPELLAHEGGGEIRGLGVRGSAQDPQVGHVAADRFFRQALVEPEVSREGPFPLVHPCYCATTGGTFVYGRLRTRPYRAS